ncbi:MAG: hypothetical protein IKZ51_06065 [Bacteroidales bacterium]|nr:hypothetical protein [Bacteroidales bacterium]
MFQFFLFNGVRHGFCLAYFCGFGSLLLVSVPVAAARYNERRSHYAN